MKQLSLAVAILGLIARVYFIYNQQAIRSVQQGSSLHQTVSQLRHDAQSPDAAADSTARGSHSAPAAAAKVPAPAVAAASPNPARGEIEAALAGLHITTIMPGQPGMFIIGKQDYSEGEDLPLPKGRKARIVAVRDDGAQLTCEGMAFHLDAPAAPDLAALRKKK